MAGEASGIRAGKAFVELSVNDKLSKAVDAAAKKLKDLGDSITSIGKKTLAIGSAITAPLLLAAQRFAAMGDEVNKASQRTGVGVEALTELKYAAEQSGVEFGDLEGSLRKMQKTLFEAASGSTEARKALAGVGLSFKDLKDLSPDQQLQLIGDRINDITDPTARAAVAMQIFGKSGTGLLPMFADGAQGMDVLRKRARALGLTFSQEDAEAATHFGDELDDLWKQINAVAFHIGAAVADSLLPFADAAHEALLKVIDWVRENRGLVFTVLAAGAALIVLGSSLIGVGLAIKTIGFALSGITSGFKFLGVILGVLTNPIVLVGAALVGLVGYFLYASGNGAKLLTWLGEKFTMLSAIAEEAFGGIADALMAGDIGLAAKILWSALKLAWSVGTHELQAKWSQFKAAMVKVAIEGFYGILDIWAIVQASFLSAVATTASTFSNTWHAAIEEVTKAFDVLEQREREREKARIERELEKPNLAPNVRDLLTRQLANVDAQADQVKAARASKDADDRLQREKDLQERLAKIKSDRDRRLAQNADDEKSISGGADTNAQKEIADMEQQQRDLERQLVDLRKKAGDEAKNKKIDNKLNDFFSFEPDEEKRIEMEKVLQNRAAVDIKSQGVFNAAAIASLQGSSVQDRIAKAAEETAKNTKEIAKKKGPTVSV